MKRAPFLTNSYGGYRMDGVRRHDQSWADLNTSADEFSAFTGILNSVLMGAAVWAALAVFVLILWGVMA
jgi:hypothetical protein